MGARRKRLRELVYGARAHEHPERSRMNCDEHLVNALNVIEELGEIDSPKSSATI